MQLSVSECKNPAYMQSQRKDHSASESSWGSTEDTICTNLGRNAFVCLLQKSLS